jgi:hypothetical protein
MNSHKYILGAFFFTVLTINADYRIVFFARSLPDISTQLDIDKIVPESLTHPQAIISRVVNARLPSHPVSSLCATYAGVLALSSYPDGQIIFPRKQQSEAFMLVVTPIVEPVIMLGKTVHHLSLIKPWVAYWIERKIDKNSGLYYWETTPQHGIDKDIIPLNAIVIFAQPHDIYVPLGITLTSASPQLMLPDVYVRRGFDIVSRILQILKIKHFFAQPTFIYKKGGDNSWMSHMIE